MKKDSRVCSYTNSLSEIDRDGQDNFMKILYIPVKIISMFSKRIGISFGAESAKEERQKISDSAIFGGFALSASARPISISVLISFLIKKGGAADYFRKCLIFAVKWIF